MKFEVIMIFISFIISSLSLPLSNNTTTTSPIMDEIYNVILLLFNELHEESDRDCKYLINLIYFKNNLLTIKHSLIYSSIRYDDIIGMNSCLHLNSTKQEDRIHFSYVLLFFRKPLTIKTNSKMLGICIPSICKTSTKNFLLKLDKYTRFLDPDKPFSYDYDVEYEIKMIDQNIHFKMVPFYILIAIIFIGFFLKTVIDFFFNYLKKKNKNERNFGFNEENERKVSIIRKFFDLGENIDYLTNIQSNLFNYEALHFINGLRAIMMFFTTVSLYLLLYYSSPLLSGTHHQVRAHMTSYSYSLIMFSSRYAPRFLIAISGFIHAYKMLCFLDIKSKEEYDKEATEIIPNENDNENDLLNNESDIVFSNNFSKTRKFVKIRHFFVFILKQFHYYFFFVLMTSIFCFSFTPLINKICGLKGSSIYIIKNWDFLKFDFFISTIFLYYNIDTSKFYNIFWIQIIEINSFLVCSLFIFLIYKYNLRGDLILIFTVFGLSLYKFRNHFDEHSPATDALPHLHDYLSSFSTKSRFYSFLYNFSFYLIGVFVGKMNYSVQKFQNISTITSNKPYLIFPYVLTKFFQKKILIRYLQYVVILLIILICFSFKIRFHFQNFPMFSSDFIFKAELLNILIVFDTEIVVFMILFILMILYKKGNNQMIKFLSSFNWTPFSKIYYVYLNIVTIVIFIDLYLTDNPLKISFFSIFFNSIYVFIVSETFSALLSLMVLIPFKKMNNFCLYFLKEEKL